MGMSKTQWHYRSYPRVRALYRLHIDIGAYELPEIFSDRAVVIFVTVDQTMVRGMAQGDFIRDLRRKRDADQVPDFAQKIYGVRKHSYT